MPDARLEVTDALGRRIVPIAKDAVRHRTARDQRSAPGRQRGLARPRRDRHPTAAVPRPRQAVPLRHLRQRRAGDRAAARARRPHPARANRRRRARVPARRHRPDPGQGHHHRDRRPAPDRRAARRPARARQRPRARRRAGAGAGFGDRGHRRRARLHHAGRRRERARVQAGARRGRQQTLPGTTFATSRKIPEEVFRTGEPKIVADLLDGELANVHMGTVALGIRNVQCVPLQAGALRRSSRTTRRRRAAHRRALSRQPREGLVPVGLDPRRARNAGHRSGGRDRKRPPLSRDDGEGEDGAGDADRGRDPAGAPAQGRPLRRVLPHRGLVDAVPLDRRRFLRLRRSAGRRLRLRAR